MRRLPVLLALLCLAATARAYEGSWLNTESPENGSYFAPQLRVSSLDDRLALWPGARLGWIVGSVISFGFEGYMLAEDFEADAPDTARFSMAVAGLALEAIPNPERRTHLVFNLMIGAGGAQAGGEADFDVMFDNSFTVIEPGAGVEFNLTRNIVLCPGVRYLWISGDVAGMESKWKVSETAFNLTLKFRDFDDS